MRTARLKHLSALPITTGLGLSGDRYEIGEPRYIRTTDIAGPHSLKANTVVTQPLGLAEKAMLVSGDLLLVSAGASIGKSLLYLSDEPACYAGYLSRVRPQSLLKGLYLSYWTQSTHFQDQVKANAVQATIENFSAARYKELRVPIFDDKQLVRIVRFLDEETAKIDNLIEKYERLLELVAAQAETRWHQLFTGLSMCPERPLKRVLWKVTRPAFAGEGVITAFRDGQVTLRANRREEGFTFSDTEDGYQGIGPGDLVYHGLDGFAGAVGVSDSHGNGSPVYHVCRPVDEQDSVHFIAAYLRFLGLSGFLATQAPNVRQRSVDFRNWETFSRIPIRFPSRHEQDAIVARLEEFKTSRETTEELTQRAISLLRERRSALITAAVTGQIEV